MGAFLDMDADDVIAAIGKVEAQDERVKLLKRAIRERQFAKAVEELSGIGRIRNVEHIGECAYGATLHYASWSALARRFAERLPGVIMPTRSGFVWICGSNGPHGAIVDNSPQDPDRPELGTRLDTIIRARSTLAQTGYTGTVPWTIGGIAKKHLLYIGPRQPYGQQDLRLLSGIPFGYHRCIPGFYPWAELYDVRSYYYSLMYRLDDARKSLRVQPTERAAYFQMWGDGERERFREVMRAVAPEKTLRNALCGAAMGSTGVMMAYTSGGCEPGKARAIELHGRPGPFRAAAYLMVRTGVELCQAEALTNGAVYGTIDSVVLTQSRPSVWPSYGLEVDRQHIGDTEIYARGNYRIGVEKKQAYKDGFRTTVRVDGVKIPDVLYHNSWL